jgi:Arylsulfotransferase (ASST)/PKD domain
MKKIMIPIVFISCIFLISISTTSAYINMNRCFSSSSSDPFNGYILFSAEYSTKTYIIDLDGEVVHSWDSKYIQGLPVYLLENGDLLRGCSKMDNTRFVAGGFTGRVEKQDWNGSLLWEFDYSTDQYCLHHDIEPLPNGNILMVAWEYKTPAEAVAVGRNPRTLQNGQLWPDKIIEVEPIGSSGGKIVWEWHVWDHLIQDFDASKQNYGVVADHPELIDINSGGSQSDFNHINSIDYNAEFDQILLSAHNQNEVWIIDHSTTTQEAAGHTGGTYGKGGDLLYRWGNPQVYDAGGSKDQQLFSQHDAKWIESGCPGAENILIFNNGMGRPDGQYSSVVEIVPPVNTDGSYTFSAGSSYLPKEPIWIYTAANPSDFYSPKVSGAQRLPNGNTLICVGDSGIFFEVTSEKVTVWNYVNPYPNLMTNNVFKIHKYGVDYPGLKLLFQQPPYTPSIPKGSTSGSAGTEYAYTTSTTDPDGDQVYYWWDWGDGNNSGWIGPYKSGVTCEAKHIWGIKNTYNIKVKAKDTNGTQSDWSDPLSITMPFSYTESTQPFLDLLSQRFQDIFLLIRHVLNY